MSKATPWPKHVGAEQPGRAALLDGVLQPGAGQRVLAAEVDPDPLGTRW